MFNVISIPQEVFVPEWLNTPQPQQHSEQQEEKVKRVATSRLTTWTDNQLKRASLTLNVALVASLIGTGLNVFWLSIPGSILGVAALTICVMSRKALHNEKVAREQRDYENEKINCQKVCVQLEQWFKDLKKTCEDLKANLATIDLQNQTATLTKESHQKLLQILNEMPKNHLNKLVEEVESSHFKMFGIYRKIGKGSWSDYWLHIQLKYAFGKKLELFYNHAIRLERKLQAIQNRKEDIENLSGEKKKLLFSFFYEVFTNFIEQNPRFIEHEMKYLSGGDNTSPQGTYNFPNLIDEIDYWSQNIKVFRSSL